MQTKDKKRMHITGQQPRQKTVNKKQRQEPKIQILYTPAKPFNRNRFLLRLCTVAAVVLALVLGMSIFFKAQHVTVSGAEKYSPWEVKEASGIHDGDALLSLSEAKIIAQIRTKLPYVGDVRVGIKLPDTVNIEITELDTVYAVEDNTATWWLVDADGRVVDTTNGAEAKNHTRIVGVQIQNAVIGQQVTAAEQQPEVDSSTGESQAESSEPTIPAMPAVSATEQLHAAIQVLSALEANGIMGIIDTVDVSDVRQLRLWYGNQYQVSLGDVSRMEYKIGAMKAAIQKMGEYQSGYLDVSFQKWPDQVGYTPFDVDFSA